MINNDMFIANDTYLDNQKNRISVITGPNMAGKSNLYASDGIDRFNGTDRMFRAGGNSGYRHSRQDFYKGRGIG